VLEIGAGRFDLVEARKLSGAVDVHELALAPS
jgi:hypothetical protein